MDGQQQQPQQQHQQQHQQQRYNSNRGSRHYSSNSNNRNNYQKNTSGGGSNQHRQRSGPRHGEERPKKEAILDLAKYQDKQVRVKFIGGREVVGILKGYDQLMNLVLDNVKETLRDPDDPYVLLDKTRDLGQVIVRGPILQGISPVEGSEAIANPF